MSDSKADSRAAFAIRRRDRAEGEDILEVGQQCSHSTCLVVDFLPIKCMHCAAPFCQEHFHPDQHACGKWDAHAADRRALECPLCATLIAIPPGEDPNVRMGQHVDQCFAAAAQGKAATKVSSTPVCARARCDKKLWVPISCEKCQKKFCAAHRHPSSHSCTSLSIPTPAQVQREEKSAKSAAALAAFKRSLAGSSAETRAVRRAGKSGQKPAPPGAAAGPSKASEVGDKAQGGDGKDQGKAAGKDKEEKDKINPFAGMSKDRRANAERKSQLKAMKDRQKRGLLSPAEEERLRALEADIKKGKDDCVVM